MSKVKFLLIILLYTSSTWADVITVGDFSHDTSTNIVTGDGLEWLQWDETIGYSIHDYQLGNTNAISGGDWRLATRDEMVELYRNFLPSKSSYYIPSSWEGSFISGIAWSENSIYNLAEFNQMFGVTHSFVENNNGFEVNYSGAFWGEEDAYGYAVIQGAQGISLGPSINASVVLNPYKRDLTATSNLVSFYGDLNEIDFGLALVREANEILGGCEDLIGIYIKLGGCEADNLKLENWAVSGNGKVEAAELYSGELVYDLSVTSEDPADGPVSFSSKFDTPSEEFILQFDYLFTEPTGSLDVTLDDFLLATFEASDYLSIADFQTAQVNVTDELLLGRENAILEFELFPGSPAGVQLDNIVILNGVTEVPEPSPLAVLASGVSLLLLRKNRRLFK